jgi:glycosyltransferase involved in cell wall biosynthesis
MKKILVITSTFPPRVSGASTIVGNLCRELNKADFCVLTYGPNPLDDRTDSANMLDCKTYLCQLPITLVKILSGVLEQGRAQYLLLPLLLLKGIWIVWKEKAKVILATVNGDGGFLVAAFLIHLVTRTPLALYAIDLWGVQGSRLERMMAKTFQKSIFQAAYKVFAISQALQEYLTHTYGVEVILLPVPVDLSVCDPCYPHIRDRCQRDFSIVFTGMIYDAQLSSIQTLVKAISSLSMVKFLVYTPRPARWLKQSGMSGPNVILGGFANHQEVRSLQRDADALFLPLSFDSVHPSVVRTAFPTKLVEYLAAGRPILVHAPQDSFVSKYAQGNGFALVVNSADHKVLRDAVQRLVADEELRYRLVENARRSAQRHDAKAIAYQLQQYLA